MKRNNLLRRISGFVLTAALLFGMATMSSTAVQARGRGGHGGGAHGGGFHGHGYHGGGFSLGFGYPGYYGYPYGYYGSPYWRHRHHW